MQGHRGTWLMWVLVALFAGSFGCSPQTDKRVAEKPSPAAASTPAPAAQDKPAEKPAAQPVAKPAEKVEPAKPQPLAELPKVALSQELLQTCLVKVDDAIPDAELPRLDGQKHRLRSLLGKSLTVLFFWTSQDPRSLNGLEDLQVDVAQALASQGVAVVAVHRGDQTEPAQAMAHKARAAFPILADADGAYFAKVATEKLPRTYLLDQDGKILWFDVEYSRTTQRDLLQAIQFMLKKGV